MIPELICLFYILYMPLSAYVDCKKSHDFSVINCFFLSVGTSLFLHFLVVLMEEHPVHLGKYKPHIFVVFRFLLI